MKLTKIDAAVTGFLQQIRDGLTEDARERKQIEQKKNRKDLVTNFDKSNEQQIIEFLRKQTPSARFLGEEGLGDPVGDLAGEVWVVDPIDGTMNFIKQRENFAVMMAYFVDGVGKLAFILDVSRNHVYHGGCQLGVWRDDQSMETPQNVGLRDHLIGISGPLLIKNQFDLQRVAHESLGTRIYGSAGIEFIKVIEGQLGGYISYLRPWDFNPGKILAEELGLVVKTIDDTRLDMLTSNTVLVATEQVSRDISAVINQS